jgi:hypothetical protein
MYLPLISLRPNWDTRLLEIRSPQSVLTVVLINVFALGLSTFLTLDEIGRHRFHWATAIVSLVCGLSAFRYGTALYRRLEQPRQP